MNIPDLDISLSVAGDAGDTGGRGILVHLVRLVRNTRQSVTIRQAGSTFFLAWYCLQWLQVLQ